MGKYPGHTVMTCPPWDQVTFHHDIKCLKRSVHGEGSQERGICCVTPFINLGLQKQPTGTSRWRNGYVTGLPLSRPRFKSWTRQLELTPGSCVCVPKIPRGECRRGGCSMAIPSGGWFLSFCLSFSLSRSGKRTHPIVKTSKKNPPINQHREEDQLLTWGFCRRGGGRISKGPEGLWDGGAFTDLIFGCFQGCQMSYEITHLRVENVSGLLEFNHSSVRVMLGARRWQIGYITRLSNGWLWFESRTQWLETHIGHVCACLRFWEGNEEGIAEWPSSLGYDFSLSLSLSVSLW